MLSALCEESRAETWVLSIAMSTYFVRESDMSQSVRGSNQVLKSMPFSQIMSWVLMCVALGLSGLSWWRSQSLLTEVASLRAGQTNWKDEAEALRASIVLAEANIRKGVEDEKAKRSNAIASGNNESSSEKAEGSTAEEALARLNFHIRSGASECKVDERCVVMEDVRPGAVIITLHLKDVGTSNRSDLLVIAPKPHESFPYNPPGILTAKYTDPASPSMLNEVDYEVVWTGARYDIYATVRTYGPGSTKAPISVHWLALPVR